jgi:hypothetical protein
MALLASSVCEETHVTVLLDSFDVLELLTLFVLPPLVAFHQFLVAVHSTHYPLRIDMDEFSHDSPPRLVRYSQEYSELLDQGREGTDG